MQLSYSQSVDGYLVPKDMTSQDPWQEARQWCQELLVMDRHCVVVGLGAGFHVAELARTKNLEKIYVIDTRPGLVNMFRKQFPELSESVEVIILENANSVLKHEIMDEVIDAGLSAFAFVSCWQNKSEVFSAIHRHVTGRSRESLEYFFKKNGIRSDFQIRDESGKSYLSIKDLEMLIQGDVSPYLRLNCFRILKELIN